MQSGALEALRERLRAALGKADSFVDLHRLRIEFDRRVSEKAHQLHLSRVIPDVRSDRAAVTGYSRDVGKRGALILNEVQDQSRNSHIDRAVIQRDFRCTPSVKHDTSRELLFRLLEKTFRGLDTDHRRWQTMIYNRRAQRSGTAPPDIQPTSPGGNAQPPEKPRRNLTAPSAHILLVGVSTFPGVRHLSLYHDPAPFLRVIRRPT
jgi:hypothetical protein